MYETGGKTIKMKKKTLYDNIWTVKYLMFYFALLIVCLKIFTNSNSDDM